MFDKTIYPYSYRAYSLNIISQLPVTGFEPTPVEKADVIIHEGPVPETLENIAYKSVLYQSNDKEFLLHIENIASYYVKNGNEIVIKRFNQISYREISVFLTGTSFGALLHQRRMLPLHASTVICNDKCFVFAGISGAGKSTLAVAFVKAGGILVADDISVINFSGEKPAVCPAFPVVKIWEDSLRHLGISSSGLKPVRDEMKKFYLPVDRFSDGYKAINQIYLLHANNQPDIEFKPLQGIDKFRMLKKYTYLFRGIHKTEQEQIHFKLVNQLATQVPISLLSRPIGEFNTNKLVKVILESH